MLLDLIFTGALYSLVLGFVAMGVMIPFRLLNFPDLTADGAYPFGAALTGVLLVNGYCNVYNSMLLAFIFSGFLGICSALIHIKLKVNSLLSGIIVSTMIYSINLRIMGKPNIPAFNIDSIFTVGNISNNIAIILLFVVIFIAVFVFFLKTEKGLKFRASGLNRNFAERQGINLNHNLYLGLFIANGLSGMAGNLMVQLQRYVDIGMGIGIVMHGLAAVMIGESICHRIKHNTIITIASPVLGAIIYQQIQGCALMCGLSPADLKLLTGIIVLAVLLLNRRGI